VSGDSLADAPQLFQGDATRVPERLRHNRFRNLVIDIALVARLFPRQPTQFAPRRPRLLGLQPSATMGRNAALLFHFLAPKPLALAVGQQIHNS